MKNKGKLALLAAVAAGFAFSGGDASGADLPPPDPGPLPPLPPIVPVPLPPPVGPFGPVGPLPPPAPPVSPPVSPPVLNPTVVLGELTRPTPQPGFLYQVKQGDNPSNVAERVRDFVGQGGSVAQWLRCMIQARYNWMLFVTRANAPGGFGTGMVDGVWGKLGSAFYPVHESVEAAVGQGRLPQRTIQWGTNPNNGNTFPKQTEFPVAQPPGYARLYIPNANPALLPDCPGFDSPAANPMPLFDALGQPVTALTPGP